MYDKRDALKINLSQIAQALGLLVEDKGAYYSCPCPYHDDNHNSFIIYDNLNKSIQGLWQCFTCGIQGDSIDLVMREKRLTFSEAVDWIGETFDLTPQELTPEQKQMIALKASITPVMIEAKNWFVSQRNEWFYEYLEERGFEDSAYKEWELGYAPNNIIDLKKHLYEKGFDDEQLVGSGLFVNKASGVEPVFYGRLMIPIRDRAGNIVGFAGRSENKYEKSKYITTTASFIKKKRLAYGLDVVRNMNNVNRLYIVEGNLDTPKFMQNTREHSVSVMGANISHEQIKEIVSTLPDLRTIVIALDGDDAGRSATLKFIKQVYSSEDFYFKHKIDFFVFNMPDGMDMDKLVTEDIEKFYELRKNIVHVIPYLMKELRKEYERDIPAKNDRYAMECLRLIASVSTFRASTFLTLLEELTGYSEERLRNHLYYQRVEYMTDNKSMYENKILRYLIDNKEDTLEEIGIPIERLMSDKGRAILRSDFSKYATKLRYMAVLDLEEVKREDAVFFGLLLFSSSIYEVIMEYDAISSKGKLAINKSTSNEINNIRVMYESAIAKVTRRIDA